MELNVSNGTLHSMTKFAGNSKGLAEALLSGSLTPIARKETISPDANAVTEALACELSFEEVVDPERW
jgi:hypothetical protein